MTNLKENLVAAVMGDMVLLPAFSVVFIALAYVYHLFIPGWLPDWAALSLIAFAILCLLQGLFLGIRSYKRNDIFCQVFAPTRKKLVLALILAIAVTIATILYSGAGIGLTAIVDIIGLSLYLYPFAALVYSALDSQLFSQHKRWIIAFLLLLNPIFIFFLRMMTIAMNQEIHSEECGVRIVSMAEGGPAESSGMAKDDIMTKFDDIEIRTLEDMRSFLTRNSPDKMRIRTQDMVFDVNPSLSGDRYILGIVGDTAYCRRDYS